MNSAFPKSGWKWLRLALAVLLPLHAGLAQATMVMPAPSAPGGVAIESQLPAMDPQSMPDDMPCHDQAAPSTSDEHPPAHKGGCCDAGSCHCVAACGLAPQAVRVGPQRVRVVPRLEYLSVPAAARPPDLRPPIR